MQIMMAFTWNTMTGEHPIADMCAAASTAQGSPDADECRCVQRALRSCMLCDCIEDL